MTNDYLDYLGRNYLLPSTTNPAGVGVSPFFNPNDYLPYAIEDYSLIPQFQNQTQNPRLRRCTPFEVMFGLCPPITPEESIEINTQEKIKQGMPEAQARQDAQDEALELKAKIPTMNQLMENIFGVNYQTIRLILFAIVALIVILVLKR